MRVPNRLLICSTVERNHSASSYGTLSSRIRRIRIGKIPLGKMPVGEWRYLPVGERF